MTSFEWDENKNQINQRQYGVSFEEAQYAFFDKKRLITKDEKHSINEQRLFCIGKIDSGIITVRFTYRKEKIRIIGAGYWRKGKKLYEQHYK
jgi:uncharacterized DUF497 family protein